MELGNDREVLVKPTLVNWEQTNCRARAPERPWAH
jgi:hypothetical protein